MYTILGADKQEYGPVSGDQIKQWILEGRANEQTLVKTETTGEWKPLAEYPEFAETFSSLKPPPPMPEQVDVQQWAQEIVKKDYELKVGDCLSKGFELFKNNFGTLFGAAFIYFLITLGLQSLTMIPVIGFLFVIVNMLIMPIILGGLYYVFISKIRGKPVGIGDLFYGFSHNTFQLIAVYIVMALLVLASAIPGGIIAGLGFLAGGIAKTKALVIIGVLVGSIVAIIPMIYLGVCWAFSIPLVVDKGLDFWEALKLSLKKVRQHWFSVFWLTIITGLINLAGVLLCGVGLFFAL
ncbi:MAG TPA: GYF domain-containing protein, partial [Verrucomicrobiota bacterium]|nr:GYF domain-containing protein [Verrucomicrobiota bacterium]